MRSFFIAVCMGVLIALSGFINPAMAQTSIGVVDMQNVLTESLAGQSIQMQVEERRKKFQAEFSKIEQELRDSQKNLAEKQETLSQEEFAAQRQAFEQKRVETLGLVQKRKAALDGAFSGALKKLEKEVMAIIHDIAAEKKYDLVLSRNNVFVNNTALDISDEVTARLDKAIPEVKVEIEETK